MAQSAIAKRIAEAAAHGGGNRINPGRGVLVVKALKDGDKPEFYSGATFVAELQVESCEGFAGNKDEKGTEKPAGNAPGSTVSIICQFDEYPDTAFKNCKEFLLALFDEKEFTAEAFPAVYDKFTERTKNEARGIRIGYSTYESKPTKKSGKILTLINWEPVKGQTAETVAESRAKLDAK